MKQIKLKLSIIMYEEDGRPRIEYDFEEIDATMNNVALLIYKMKQIEQELIDRDWNHNGEGYEVEY